MKKILPILIGILGFTGSVFALPYYSSQQGLIPFVNSTYYLGTTTPSTIAWKGVVADQLCLTADSCKTVWPISASAFWPFTKLSTGEQATSTTMAWLNGFISTASSTLTDFNANNSTTTNATTTSFYNSGLASTTDLRANTANIGIANIGSPADTAAPLVITGGSGGNSMVKLVRTSGANITYSWALTGGGLGFTSDTDGFTTLNLFGSGGVNQLFVGQSNTVTSGQNTRDSLISGTTVGTGLGADKSTGNLIIQGNLGTGAGVPGDILLKTGTILSTGSTVQTGSTRLTVKGDSGFVGIGTTAPGGPLQISSTQNLDQAFGMKVNTTHNTATGGTVWGASYSTSAGNSSGTMNAVQSLFAQAIYQGTSAASPAVNALQGAFFRTVINGTSPTGTVANGYGFFLDSVANFAVGTPNVTFTRQFGVAVNDQGAGSGTNGLTITSAAGFAITDQTTATNHTNLLLGTLTIPTGSYSIYNSSANNNYFNGSTGIGTTSPLTRLSVQGSGTADVFTVASSTGAPMLYVNNGGRVGIGTASPGALLDVQGTTFFGSSGVGQGILETTGSDISIRPFIAGRNLLLNRTGGGFVGIGTSTPWGVLSVVGTGDPIFVVATSTGNTVGGYDGDGHTFTDGPAPLISSCGTGAGTVVGDDQAGTITTATAATSCTATFSKAYQATPICTVTDNSLVGFADIASISKTAVTFGISSALTGGNLYYQCTYHR